MVSKRALVGVVVAVILILAAIFIGFTQFGILQQPRAETEKKIKIAAILPGTIEDLSFNAEAYKALVAVKRDYGVEISFTDRVGPADWEKVATTYASEGYDVVYLHGAEFTELAYKLAKKFPNVFFINAPSGGVNEPLPNNLLYVLPAENEIGYVGGVVAAMLSKSDKVGIVLGFDYPVIIALAEGFKLGARSVNPNIKVYVVYAGTWDDPLKGKAIANAMIDQGVDVITHWADLTGLGALDAAKERGIIALGGISDQLRYAPNIATSILLGVYDFVYWSLSGYIKGILPKGEVYLYSLKDGLEPLGDWNKHIVPDDVIKKAEEIKQKIIKGEIKVPFITEKTD